MENPLKKFKQEKFSTYQSHLSSLPSSSFSSSSTPDFEYDVFISFRGKDTRKRFTNHLFTSLDENGIATFMDDQELETGKGISPEILQAIKTSRLFLIVLSENYADSRWCLDELVHIIKHVPRKGYIIPIFYDVDPTVVRNQTDSYKKAFSNHEEKYSDQVDKINEWRLALTTVANNSGWHLNDRCEAEFIKYIVNDVFRKLGDTSMVLDELELDTMSELVNSLKGTYEGFCGEISDEFKLHKSDNSHGFKYDVFLSSRGHDTRKNFTAHLYEALYSHGITTYLDDFQLCRGNEINPELQQAIENSKLSIVIFSRNYASSAWCLNELVHILECRKTSGNVVLPIFYHVDPNEVRHQTGSYGETFAKLEKQFSDKMEKIGKWRDALREVTNLSGRHMGERHEVDLISDTVRIASHTLSVSVGIDINRVDKLISHLEDNNVRIIGLWGMAGIGKTAITEAIYNRISHKFDVCCLLPNVKEGSLRFGLNGLQQQLLGRIQHISVSDVQHGIGLIKNHFCSKRVLLVIDNVDKLDQLQALAGDSSWFGSGSRIIITTRDKNLLASLKEVEPYEIEGLNYDEAIKLFSLNAFGESHPRKQYHDKLCDHVVEYANGNPLTLKVIGSFLFGRNINEWIYSLDNIKSLTQEQIFGTLRISYDSLDEESKSILLHISCFLNGKSVDRVSEVLDCCGYQSKIGMKLLIDKSFVTVSNTNTVRMHHFAQKMGQEIVRQECISEPGRRSRLWHDREINDAMVRNLGTESVEAIVLDHPDQLEGHWNHNAFSNLCNLKWLSIRSNIHLPEGLECLPETLRFLKWRAYPLKSLPSDFYPLQLVELRMCHSQIEQLWWEEKILKDLKCIDLSHSKNLIRTLDFTRSPNLEKLILEGCTSLVEVHPSFGTLKRLRLLNLKDCTSLRSLPCAAMSLESLEICLLSGCSKLDHMDKVVASLVSGSPKILKLSLRNCDLEDGAIPSDIDCLTSLEVLDIGGNNFRGLPKSISRLSKLKFLGLAHCNLLESVPELPSSVEYVEARDCCSLLTFSNPLKVRPSTDFVLSFINCSTLRLDAITWLKAYLRSLMLDNQNQELSDSHLIGRFDIIVPGTRIPKWFRHQNNMGPSVTVPLPPNRNNRNWIGFVFCVVFGVHQNYSEEKLLHEIDCQLYADEIPIGNRFGFCISNSTLSESDHLWLRYVSNGSFGKRMLRWNRIGHITASFGTQSQCLEFKKCGLRAVYKQDVEETDTKKFQYICSPTEDLGVGFFSY